MAGVFGSQPDRGRSPLHAVGELAAVAAHRLALDARRWPRCPPRRRAARSRTTDGGHLVGGPGIREVVGREAAGATASSAAHPMTRWSRWLKYSWPKKMAVGSGHRTISGRTGGPPPPEPPGTRDRRPARHRDSRGTPGRSARSRRRRPPLPPPVGRSVHGGREPDPASPCHRRCTEGPSPRIPLWPTRPGFPRTTHRDRRDGRRWPAPGPVTSIKEFGHP